MPRTQLAFLVMIGWLGQRFLPESDSLTRGGLWPWQSLMVALEKTRESAVMDGSVRVQCQLPPVPVRPGETAP